MYDAEELLHLSSKKLSSNLLSKIYSIAKASENNNSNFRHYRNIVIFPKHLPFNEKKNCLDTKLEWSESVKPSSKMKSYSVEF